VPTEKTPVAKTSLWRGVPQQGMDHTIDDGGISSTANILSGRKCNLIKKMGGGGATMLQTKKYKT